ncbi:MAG: TolC family protein, partial [Bacteroidota bacterium]|nr:TolC family protein [Bacteroidota bacterium]
MNMFQKISLPLKKLFPLFLFSFAYAQVPPQKISLEDAVRLAVKQNPELESARLEVKRSDARVLEAWGSAMPSLDLAGHYVHMIDKPVTFFPDYFLYSFLKTA